MSIILDDGKLGIIEDLRDGAAKSFIINNQPKNPPRRTCEEPSIPQVSGNGHRTNGNQEVFAASGSYS